MSGFLFPQNGLPDTQAKFHILFLFFSASMFSVSLASLFIYHCWLVCKNRSTLGKWCTSCCFIFKMSMKDIFNSGHRTQKYIIFLLLIDPFFSLLCWSLFAEGKWFTLNSVTLVWEILWSSLLKFWFCTRCTFTYVKYMSSFPCHDSRTGASFCPLSRDVTSL